jgi:hypothetical protein
MGHLVPLTEGVDAGAAGFVEAGGVEDPDGEVGVGSISLTHGPSPRGRGEEGIGGRGGMGCKRDAGGRGQSETESGGLLEQPASISRQARAASGSSFEVMAESPVNGVEFCQPCIALGNSDITGFERGLDAATGFLGSSGFTSGDYGADLRNL